MMPEYYIVFAGYKYYPGEGLSDYRGKFGTIEDAKDYLLRNKDWDWAEIVRVTDDGLETVELFRVNY